MGRRMLALVYIRMCDVAGVSLQLKMSTPTEGSLENYGWGDRFHNYEGTYRGDIIETPRRIPHGYGIFIGTGNHEGGPPTYMRYEGEWVDGKREGSGRCTQSWESHGSTVYPAGSTVYEGEFYRDEFHGRGKLTGRGYTMEGEWANGFLRYGALRLDDGRWFKGAWVGRYTAQYPTKGVLGAADGTRSEVEFNGWTFLTVDKSPWPAPTTSTPL